MLTGTLPYTGLSDVQIMKEIRDKAPPKIPKQFHTHANAKLIELYKCMTRQGVSKRISPKAALAFLEKNKPEK